MIGDLDLIPLPGKWVQQALCAETDPEEFFPEKNVGNTRMARAVCARCPVTAECLEDALARNERFGVWGGLSERERREVARQRRTAAQTAEAA